MEKFRKILRAFWQQMAAGFSRKNVAAGYLLGLTIILKNAIHYSSFVGKHTVNAVESYIVSFSNKGDVMLLIIGCVIVLSDAPFITAASFSMIHRVGRKCWYGAMWLYMEAHCLLYYLILFLASLIPFMFKGYAENAWSQTMLRVVKGNADIMADYSLAPPGSNVILLSPYKALIHTTAWVALYTLCLSAVLFVFNMTLNKSAAGTIAAGCVHIVSMMMCFEWFIGIDMSKWSLFRNAVFPVFYAPQSISVFFTYCYFAIVLYLVYIAGDHILPFTSFVLDVGEVE